MRDGSLRQRNFFKICGKCRLECCRDARPPITRRRREIIEAYIRRRGISFEEPFAVSDYTYPREDEKGYCIFYDKGSRRCVVQPVKPETCVAGPITFDVNVDGGKIEWYLKTEKICPLAGVMFRDETMLKRHLEAARREIYNLLKELEPPALKAILMREEPDTFKIGEEGLDDALLRKLR